MKFLFDGVYKNSNPYKAMIDMHLTVKVFVNVTVNGYFEITI